MKNALIILLNKVKTCPAITPVVFNLTTAGLLTLVYNGTFYGKISELISQHFSADTYKLFFAVGSVHFLLNFILLTLFASGPWQKVVLSVILFISAAMAYFMDVYGVVVDRTMLLNIINTDTHEVLDLLTWRLFAYLLFLGILPALVVSFYPRKITSYKNALAQFFASFVFGALLLVGSLLLHSDFYASFFREHRSLRYYVNPLQPLYSIATFWPRQVASAKSFQEIEHLGPQAHISKGDRKRDLVIFVLGETARAQNFSLNGYQRETNPLLAKEDVVSFGNMFSCGTSTAVSVPCMFSIFGRSAYTHEKFTNTENLADVLWSSGQIDVLWRDNNSNSKGVAVRVPYEDFKTSSHNKVCDQECRDIGMLDGLQAFIDRSQKTDIFIVLHQMGNHGPAYYKRYPKEFEVFRPTCQTAELEMCSQQEIVNAYDNAILYTDYFLSRVVQLLKENDERFETAMLYVSDHGESLGENGIYLHGLPYHVAPEEQKKVGAIFWLGKGLQEEIKLSDVKARAQQDLNHDYLFHTLLGLFEVETPIYDKSKDILH